jgi:hypothetical protein
MLLKAEHRVAVRWAIAAATVVIGAVLTAATAEALGLPGRVTVLETNEKSNKELLQEMRLDVKELLRR